MNLAKLMESQIILNDRIEKEHPRVPGEDRLAKMALALQVELAECANEWRGFKFWSNAQEPRISHFAPGVADSYNYNPLLEEYVDGLHLILDLAIELKIHVPQTISYELSMPHLTVTEVFVDLIQGAYWFLRQKHRAPFPLQTGWVQYFAAFYKLGEMLGFTWEEIEDAYYAKNKINHERQATGY
ncbi:dUTP diphosphatase [Psychrobacillus psychrodurans]|uniref:dUTP diphosphatase n=1 Tax=Psychrobacillus psychrodurans TaxID=126157 RepID=UPI001F4ED73F|nr:dUTP diphosphatase [Psychrobacillus psychrodurans]